MPSYANRTLVEDTVKKIGQTVTLYGSVDSRRDHGKLIFIDLRDRSGLIQCVVTPTSNALNECTNLRDEYVISLEGIVKERPGNLVNPNMETGLVEIEVYTISILSAALQPPFELHDTKIVNEEARLAHRYVDLRSQRMQHNIRLRHKVAQLARDYLISQDFVEIETPLLTQSSPEGARDFLVPSRLQPGKFYALPQSPQQYKQLLMIAGFERYFQLARCLRDEDLRGDRQLEHTQIDIEMAFASQEEVREITEAMMIHVVESLGKTVTTKPFPVYTHSQAIAQFGSDKFDLRNNPADNNEFAFAWVIDFPLFETDQDTGKLTFAHNPFSAPRDSDVDKLMAKQDLKSLIAQQYDLVCNGLELASGGVRISKPDIQRKIFEIMGLTSAEIESRFGHLINAYSYGAPPHAGIAPGLDRLTMLLANEDNIREVTAFPVTSKGSSSVMHAPSPVTPQQLKELHIRVDTSATE